MGSFWCQLTLHFRQVHEGGKGERRRMTQGDILTHAVLSPSIFPPDGFGPHWRLRRTPLTWPPSPINMGRKHVFHLYKDESNWWTGQPWKIDNPIWSLSKVERIYLAGSNGREVFPCFSLCIISESDKGLVDLLFGGMGEDGVGGTWGQSVAEQKKCQKVKGRKLGKAGHCTVNNRQMGLLCHCHLAAHLPTIKNNHQLAQRKTAPDAVNPAP